MSNINILAFCLIVIHSSSCRPQDQDSKEGAPSNDETDGRTSVSIQTTEIHSNGSERRPAFALTTEVGTAEVATEEQIDEAGLVPSGEGRIVLSQRLMSFGDEYLLGIKNGSWKYTIPELSQKDVAGIDLVAIRAETSQLRSPNPEIKISDPITAYARVLDLGISMLGEMGCLGTFTDENEDSYFVFYGIQEEPLSLYTHVFYVNKNDGHITLYRRRL